MTEMNVSENLWNEDELLEQLEQMQDQIEKLQAENEEIITYRREAEIWHMEQEQKLSSEISALQLTLQQAQNKLQEQSAQIVRLNNADLILKENEKLQKEVEDARVTMSLYEQEHQKKMEQLETECMKAQSDRKTAAALVERETEKISERAEQICREELEKSDRKWKQKVKKMTERHQKELEPIKTILFLSVISQFAVLAFAAYTVESFGWKIPGIHLLVYSGYYGLHILRKRKRQRGEVWNGY